MSLTQCRRWRKLAKYGAAVRRVKIQANKHAIGFTQTFRLTYHFRETLWWWPCIFRWIKDMDLIYTVPVFIVEGRKAFLRINTLDLPDRGNLPIKAEDFVIR